MTEELHRDIGRHGAQIESLQDQMELVLRELHEIKTTLAEAKGGWRMLVMIGGAGAAFGAAIVKFFAFFGVK
jgi:prefoldin subunit 5